MTHNKSLLKYKVKMVLGLLRVSHPDINVEDINALGREILINNGEIGSSFYDLIITLDHYSLIPDKSNVYFEMCKDFTSKYSEKEFIKFIRKVIFTKEDLSNEISTHLLILVILLQDFYGEGMIVGFNGNRVFREGLFTSRAGSYLDVMLMFWEPIFIAHKEEQLKSTPNSEKIFSKSDVAKIQLEIAKLDMSGVTKINYTKLGVGLQELIQHYGDKMPALLGRAAASPVRLSSSVYIYSCVMEREYTNSIKDEDSVLSVAITHIIQILPQTLLRKRKYYLREKGVFIKTISDKAELGRIYLTEVHDIDSDEHYIFIKTEDKDGNFTRVITLPINNIQKGLFLLLFEKDYITVMFILFLLGLWDEVVLSIKQDNSEEELIKFLEGMLKSLQLVFDETEIRYEEPYSWNDNGDYIPYENSGSKKAKVLSTVHVGRYVRALPINQTASSEAIKLAEKYQIDLKEGYTLVEEFDRVAPTNLF